MEEDKIFAVSVLSGSHRGATMALAAGSYRFGQSLDADIVLQDSGIAPLHFNMDLTPEGASIACAGGAVTLDGVSKSRSKSSAKLHYPFDILADDVRIRVDGPDSRNLKEKLLDWSDLTAWREKGEIWLRQYRRRPLIAALMVLAASVFAIGATATTSTRTQDPADFVVSAGTPHNASTGDLAEALRREVAAQGLADLLKISASGEAVAVRGQLTAEQMQRWQDIRKNIDAAYGNSYTIDSQINTVAAADRPHLELQAIWAGPPANVITSAGDRLAEGDQLANGWKIEKIEASRVTLTDGNQRVVLTY